MFATGSYFHQNIFVLIHADIVFFPFFALGSKSSSIFTTSEVPESKIICSKQNFESFKS